MSTQYKKAILYLFYNIKTLIKIQSDELVTFHSIPYLSVASQVRVQASQLRVLFP